MFTDKITMTTDATALQRQNRRIERLKEQGVTRTTVLVHSECKPALEGLRHHFVDPDKAQALASLVEQLHDKRSRRTLRRFASSVRSVIRAARRGLSQRCASG